MSLVSLKDTFVSAIARERPTLSLLNVVVPALCGAAFAVDCAVQVQRKKPVGPPRARRGSTLDLRPTENCVNKLARDGVHAAVRSRYGGIAAIPRSDTSVELQAKYADVVREERKHKPANMAPPLLLVTTRKAQHHVTAVVAAPRCGC